MGIKISQLPTLEYESIKQNPNKLYWVPLSDGTDETDLYTHKVNMQPIISTETGSIIFVGNIATKYAEFKQHLDLNHVIYLMYNNKFYNFCYDADETEIKFVNTDTELIDDITMVNLKYVSIHADGTPASTINKTYKII